MAGSAAAIVYWPAMGFIFFFGGILITFHSTVHSGNEMGSCLKHHKISAVILRNFTMAKCVIWDERKLLCSNVYKAKGFNLGKRKDGESVSV